jgi:hypothetical protein
MLYSDLKPYRYCLPVALDDVVTIGWLSPLETFPTADADQKLVQSLAELSVSHRVNKTRGYHLCEFCKSPQPIELKLHTRGLLLGSAEMWIPSQDESVIYAAPDLIVHYVNVHKYRPPQEFLDAVTNARARPTWNPEAECEKRLDAAFMTKRP